MPDEMESDSIKIAGLVTKKFSEGYSRPSASGSHWKILCSKQNCWYYRYRYRALVRHIRSKGAMNAIISSEESVDIDELKKILNEHLQWRT
jgi:carbamoyl-phosphate synthase small subunit